MENFRQHQLLLKKAARFFSSQPRGRHLECFGVETLNFLMLQQILSVYKKNFKTFIALRIERLPARIDLMQDC